MRRERCLLLPAVTLAVATQVMATWASPRPGCEPGEKPPFLSGHTATVHENHGTVRGGVRHDQGAGNCKPS